MDILVVANGIPNIKTPLLGIFEFDQAKALADAGAKVVFFGVDLRSIRRSRKWGIVTGVKDGIEYYVINIPLGAIPLNILCNIGAVALEILYNYVYRKRSKPDIIHAHFTDIGYMSAKLSKKQNIPLIITEHSSLMNREECPKTLLKYASKGYKGAEKVLAVSSALKKNIFINTKVRCKVVPNILSVDEFYLMNRKIHKGFGFVITANLVSIKNHALLLEAFSNIKQEYAEIYLGIVGDGPLRKELEAYVEKNHLDDCVKFYGRLQRNEIAKLYELYDCFVLPSNSETFGVAYIEAMAAGLPVIASRCGGPEDFVDDNNGILIDVGNKEQLVAAMHFMINNKEKFDEYEIRNNVVEQFSPKTVSKQLMDIYDQILEGKCE